MKVPSDEEMSAVAEDMIRDIGKDESVKVFRAANSFGEYAGEYEKSYDLEMTVRKDIFDEGAFIGQIVKTSQKHDQWDNVCIQGAWC